MSGLMRGIPTIWIESFHTMSRTLKCRRPLVIERNKDPSGVLRGKTAIREYWAIGLAAVPPLKFELIDVHVGINSIGILYRSIGRRRVIEMLTFNQDKEIVRGGGLYGGPA